MKLAVFLTFLIVAGIVNAQTQVYEAEASRDGKLVYREKHEVTFEKGKILSSHTTYTDQDGKEIGILDSDYRPSLAAPAHTMNDIRSKNKHGVRYENGKVILFNQNENKKEETQTLDEDKKEKLVVAAQGLHYYLVSNLEGVIEKKKLDLKFLIPGRLDAYNFYLKLISVNENKVEFEIKIDNWFLRLFAPKLKLIYDLKMKRLLFYQGLSNIRDPKGDMMNVEIKYNYKN